MFNLLAAAAATVAVAASSSPLYCLSFLPSAYLHCCLLRSPQSKLTSARLKLLKLEPIFDSLASFTLPSLLFLSIGSVGSIEAGFMGLPFRPHSVNEWFLYFDFGLVHANEPAGRYGKEFYQQKTFFALQASRLCSEGKRDTGCS